MHAAKPTSTERLRALNQCALPSQGAGVLSPSTRELDKAVKLPIYQREAVAHVWVVDPDAQLLEVLRLDGASYRVVQTLSSNIAIHRRAEPFDAIELDVGALWQREARRVTD